MYAKTLKNAFFTSLALILISCSLLVPAAAPSAADVEKEEQAVYAALLKGGNPDLILVILPDTVSGFSNSDSQEKLDNIKSGLAGLSNETWVSFMQRNQQSSLLSAEMNLGVEYVLPSEFTFDWDWEAFYEKYHTLSFLQLSRVGFNNSLNQAMVYSVFVGGMPMSDGYYQYMSDSHFYMLEKQNGQWVIAEKFLAGYS